MKKNLSLCQKFAQKHLSKPWVALLYLFSLVFFRTLFYGFQYFHQLDDYIQFHNYALYPEFTGNSIWKLIELTGYFSYRPLAGVLDLTLWTALFDHMIWGVALITLLYAWSAWLFYRLFQEFFPCSPLFLVIYTLMPLGFEGTYWMSASTRIIPGLFFTALALHYLHLFCKEGGKGRFVLYFLAQCLSYCFYEQSIAFSITCVALLSLFHLCTKEIRSLAGLSFLPSLGIFLLITNLAPTAPMASGRTNYIFPSTPYYFEMFLPDLLQQLQQSFLEASYFITAKGFLRGIHIVWDASAFGYLFLILLLPLGLFFLSKQDKNQTTSSLVGMVVGVLLFLAPVSIFFIIENPWFSLRNTVTSFVGLALTLDVLVTGCSKNIPSIKSLPWICAYGLSVVFLLASVSELTDYKDSYEDDLQIATVLYPTLSQMSVEEKVAVYGIEASYLSEQNYYFHDHVKGTSYSDWSLTGRMTAFAKVPVPAICPFSLTETVYFPYESQIKRPENFTVHLLYDHESGQLSPLEILVVEPGVLYHFYDSQGNLVGILEENQGFGQFNQN